MENPDEMPRSAFVKDFVKAWHDSAVSFAEEVQKDDFRMTGSGAFTVTHRGDLLQCRVVVHEQNGRCGVLFYDAGPVEAIDPPLPLKLEFRYA